MDRGFADTDGHAEDVEYLSRCQVDTPPEIVELTWKLIRQRRANAGAAVDYGCGDARFARAGIYEKYTGFEIDRSRAPKNGLPRNAEVRIACAFATRRDRGSYQTCVQNPPYVRHHDLTKRWIERAERRLTQIAGYIGDGRANAYVYFMWLGLDAIADDGLAAFVVPYEWVSRPASQHLRAYIAQKGWAVDVYHLTSAKFDRVLTTACITIIDKSVKRAKWGLFDLANEISEARQLKHITRSEKARLTYENAIEGSRANRGLSPGDQDFFVLTEGQRIKYRLVAGEDVVPAVTTFRHIVVGQNALTESLFRTEFVNQGKRCWLVNTDKPPSVALQAYLDTAPEKVLKTYTCKNRGLWWKFTMPQPADILYASGFKGTMPKLFLNEIAAIHVGGVHGVYCKQKSIARDVLQRLRATDISGQVVPLAKGFLKLEVNQMNSILNRMMRDIEAQKI